jgi:hypothetical protein
MFALVTLRMLTKIRLSPEELMLAKNAEVLLTKNRIMQKACDLFAELAEQVTLGFEKEFNKVRQEIFLNGPKISRGEQYKGLPYVILDHPRIFSRQDVFAIRTMFWWGHYFIQTLHLKGLYHDRYANALIQNAGILSEAGIYISNGNDEWLHDFEEPNFLPVSGISQIELKERIQRPGYLKLAIKISLDDWNAAIAAMLRNYRLLSVVLTINYPDDGKGL